MTISAISQAIHKAFDNVLKAASVIPPILMICSLAKRPGLSAMKSSAKVIADQAKFGGPTGPLPDNSANMMNGLINIIITEVYRALREDANIQVALAPNSVTVQCTGSNAGGPVISVGTNILPVKGVAQIL